MKKSPLLVALCLAAGALRAEAPRPLQGFLNLGLTFGGDTLDKVAFTDGSTDSITGGGGGSLKGGVNYTFTKAFSIQASYGIHQESTKKASNGGIDFDRTFLEGLAFYHPTETFKLGGGLRKVLDAQLKERGEAGSAKVDYDSDPSLVLEVEWHTRHFSNIQWALNLRYVNEKYTPSTLTGVPGPFLRLEKSQDGSHFGVGVTFYF